MLITFSLLVFQDRVSLYSCPGTHRGPLLPKYWGLKVCPTMPGWLLENQSYMEDTHVLDL